MSCERAVQEEVEALNEWVDANNTLRDLERSYMGGLAMTTGEFEELVQLTDEVDRLGARRQETWKAFVQARQMHQK